MEGNKTVAGTLLNKKARFPAGPFLLANAFRVPVSFVFGMKETRFHYHFYASPPKIYPKPRPGEPVILDDFCKQMESMVRKYPLQWYNYYDFWEKEED
jgi:predicted LPLAT superfamily acyltransferase